MQNYKKKMVQPHQIRFYALNISINDTFKGGAIVLQYVLNDLAKLRK